MYELNILMRNLCHLPGKFRILLVNTLAPLKSFLILKKKKTLLNIFARKIKSSDPTGVY